MIDFLSMPPKNPFDIVVIGTGFGSSFFLHKLLRRSPQNIKILVLEWGAFNRHKWQVDNRQNSPIVPADVIHTSPESKPWNFTIGFGGGSNCWWGQTPRFHPADFELNSRYGVGRDWPISYSELEPYYCEAEYMMSISGDPDMAHIMPRSREFPQKPHRPSSIDALMKAADATHNHFIMPTARARVSTKNRPQCCASLVCGICPANAKFTIQNELINVYLDPRVSVLLDAKVESLDIHGNVLNGVNYIWKGDGYTVKTDLCILGANAIFSPYILLKSNMENPFIGRSIHEQLGYGVEVFLDGINNFDGSTQTTGLNYRLYDGAHRREVGAALIYFENSWKTYGLRTEQGRWRQTLPLIIVAEDLPNDENRVYLEKDQQIPLVHHPKASEYAHAGIQRALDNLEKILAPLPIESIKLAGWRNTESHIQGTLRMGSGSTNSVVDKKLIHHDCRNLLVVGTSVFPSCSCANPSLTAAALSLYAADQVLN